MQILRHSKKETSQLSSFDVLAWTLEQSCQALERAQPLRLLQGLNYLERKAAMSVANSHLSQGNDRAPEEDVKRALRTLEEPENQGLFDLYAPTFAKANTGRDLVERNRSNDDPMAQEIIRLIDSLPHEELFLADSLDEEHEREIQNEREKVTQVQRPPLVEPLKPCADACLEPFITSGKLDDFHKFPLAYDVVLLKTSIKSLESKRHPWYHLRVSKDFAETVKRPTSGFFNNYLRPVNFILTNKLEMKPVQCLIISPFEANKYLRLLQSPESKLTLHIYEPRVAKAMMSVDEGIAPLSKSVREWKSVSGGLMRAINLFAGQTYYKSHKDYKKSVEELGPRLNEAIRQTRTFVRQWYAIRRMGQDFTQTHIGFFLEGKELKKTDFAETRE